MKNVWVVAASAAAIAVVFAATLMQEDGVADERARKDQQLELLTNAVRETGDALRGLK